jgi:hypothetical protein
MFENEILEMIGNYDNNEKEGAAKMVKAMRRFVKNKIAIKVKKEFEPNHQKMRSFKED